jgi:hypothetical protein
MENLFQAEIEDMQSEWGHIKLNVRINRGDAARGECGNQWRGLNAEVPK